MLRATMLTELQSVLRSNPSFADWSQSILLGYLAEGQDRFCEKTGYFIDLSSFSITLQTGVSVYAIPDRIIQIIAIWNGTFKLQKVDTGNVFSTDSWFQSTATGPPTAWQTDQETGVITVYPTPTANENGTVLPLQVWRYSLYDLAGDGPAPEGGGDASDAEPEIPSRFQRACIEWAAYKAFNHRDIETQDPVKAADHLKAFDMYVNDGIAAMRRFHGIETRVEPSPVYLV